MGRETEQTGPREREIRQVERRAMRELDKVIGNGKRARER
jgi:hypothetical protein